MDDRVQRLGEHAAMAQPLWARQALGLVPQDPAAARDWEHRASVIASYRERYGYDHPADPIGPEPAGVTPEARAAWHAALASLGRIDGLDLRRCTDGELRRGTFERETAWAPPHVASDLGLIRIAKRDAHVNATRAEHESRLGPDARAAARHRELGVRWRAIQVKAAAEARMFTGMQQTRADWEPVTQTTRPIAVAADTELRRRHPRMPITPLTPHPAETTAAAQLTDAERLTALGLTLGTATAEIPAEVYRASRAAAQQQAKIDKLKSLPLPAGEPTSCHPASPGQCRPSASAPPSGSRPSRTSLRPRAFWRSIRDSAESRKLNRKWRPNETPGPARGKSRVGCSRPRRAAVPLARRHQG
ncbi:MAG: hypothetical protein ACRDRL_32825 [Sciscionella sp.]